MAIKSNFLLRQKVCKQRKTPTQTKVNSNQTKITINAQTSNLSNGKQNEQIYTVQTTDDIDDNDVEYVTVIVANDDQSGEESMECLMEDSSAVEIIENDPCSINGTGEIPKMSLPRHRGRKRSQETSNRSLTCQECGKTLSNFSSYKYHMQLHSNKTPFLCSECGEGFKTRNAYDGMLSDI